MGNKYHYTVKPTHKIYAFSNLFIKAFTVQVLKVCRTPGPTDVMFKGRKKIHDWAWVASNLQTSGTSKHYTVMALTNLAKIM